jgi:hypothetical protein
MPSRKRTAVHTPKEPRRRSGRVSSTKKSTYFEGSDSDDVDESALKPSAAKRGGATQKTPSRATKRAKKDDYEPEESEEQYEEVDDDDEDNEDDVPVKTSAKRGRPNTTPIKSKAASRQATKKDAQEDDDDDDDDPKSRITIIPIAKLRDTGGVEYEDETVHKNTMLFLKDLKANNVRSWLKCMNCPAPAQLTTYSLNGHRNLTRVKSPRC